MKKRLIIVDVSNFIFRAFFAIRHMSSPDGTPTNAVYGVLSMLMKLISEYRPTHILVARDTAGGTFRNELYDEYKANRSEPPEELVPQFSLIKELMEKMELPICADDNFEADDIIGSACTQWKKDFDEILIASGDKDLMQFVDGNVKMLDTMKDKIYDEKAVFEKMGVRPDQIVDYLSMVGDSSDNIPGMRGIGAKGAAKLLAEHGTLDKCIEVKDTFKGKKLTTAFSEYLEDGLLSRKLIQIVTDMDLQKSANDVEFRFYPSDDLIKFLEGLGFKTIPNKLRTIREQVDREHHEGDPEFVHLDSEKHHKKSEVVVVNDDESYKNLLTLIEGTTALSLYTDFDTEDIYSREILGVGISLDGKSSYYVPFIESNLKDKQKMDLLKSAWGSDHLEILSDHIQKDLSFAMINDIDFNAQTFDISQAFYNLSSSSKNSLEHMSEEYLSEKVSAWNRKKDFDQIKDVNFAGEYFGHRASAVFELTEIFKKNLKKEELEDVYYDIDDKLFPILSEMQNNGVSIDEKFFTTYEKELQKLLDSIEEEIASHNDGEPINLNSPKQVGELLFTRLELPIIKKTKTGVSTDSEVLTELASRDISPVPKLLLEYRETSKLLSTYVKVMPTLVNTTSKRIHTTFNQNVAATGRLSSTNPNLQNIPVRSEAGRKIRKGFVAKKGTQLLGCDYSQVELRLLAHFSKDPTMLKAFKEDKDIHAQTASEVLGVALEDVTSNDRSIAKAVNFGLMYGQSSFGLSKALGISRKEAKEYITKYFERFSKVKGFLDGLKEECEKTGYALSYYGRKRFLPDINSNNRTVKAMAERMAINSPIQGTAADIIKMAMINIDERLKREKLKSKMILQVHDELIFEVPDSEIDKMKKLVVEEMESVADLDIPLKVDMGIATNWFDLK